MEKIKRICPVCKEEYEGYPAISRADNVTEICPKCGAIEALKSMGLSDKEIKKIIKIIPTFEDM